MTWSFIHDEQQETETFLSDIKYSRLNTKNSNVGLI